MIILGISLSHDAGAAVIKDGRIISAVNEERLNRVKMYWGFPKLSISEAIKLANINPSEIDYVAVSNLTMTGMEEGSDPNERMKNTYEKNNIQLGKKLMYQFSKTNFIGSNSFEKPTQFLSPDSRLLAWPLDESVTLVADQEAFRFNMPLGKHITEISWYGDSEHLFIRSGNELYFLDAALGLPINLTKIAENVKQYSYDARTKRLYLLIGNVLEYLIF